MPIKSKAQRRKFAQLLVEGKISPETFEEWNRTAGNAELPERLHPKAKLKRKRKTKSKRSPKSKTTRAKKRNRPASKSARKARGTASQDGRRCRFRLLR